MEVTANIGSADRAPGLSIVIACPHMTQSRWLHLGHFDNEKLGVQRNTDFLFEKNCPNDMIK